MELGGIHHITAVTANASRNVGFYTDVLGLRLVKKTVNQDDVTAYHLFYGDEVGNAGTEMTFFDWSFAGPHQLAAGTVSASAFRVPGRDALEWWTGRLDELGVSRGEIQEREGRAYLPFTDPEGQSLELVDDSEGTNGGATGTTPGTPWERGPVGSEHGVRGLEGATLTVKRLEPTAAVLTQALGFREAGEHTVGGGRVVTFEVGPGGPGAEIRVAERPEMPLHRMVGAGGVHHVAYRVPDDEQHAAWREYLAGAGLGVTPVIDRHYFRSIYFREPGGVLFEIATDGPGFTVDESPENLGEMLSLPPFLESRRQEIEAGLQPITPAGHSA